MGFIPTHKQNDSLKIKAPRLPLRGIKIKNRRLSMTNDWRDKYDEVGYFSEGFAPVELGGKWGSVNKRGKEVVPLKYDLVWLFSKGLARVELNGKFGFGDKEGFVDKEGNEYWDMTENQARKQMKKR